MGVSVKKHLLSFHPNTKWEITLDAQALCCRVTNPHSFQPPSQNTVLSNEKHLLSHISAGQELERGLAL
jgi:hypothetical protein